MACLPNINLRKTLLTFGLLVMGFTSMARAGTWWNDEWPLRKKIIIDTSDKGAAISDPIGTEAVLLRLHDGNFNFAAVKEDGSDLRFVSADDKTLLPYHIEKFDSLLNEAFVWVKVPDLKPSAQTSIWMYFGNAGPKAVKAEDAKGTFDADTVLVYHFAEKNAPAADSSGNSNNAQNAIGSVEGSQIGSGGRLDGKTPLTIPNSPTLGWAPGGTMTLTAWIKPTILAPKSVLFSRREGKNSFVIGLDNGAPYITIDGQTSAPGAAPLAPNAWRHLAVISDNAKTALYLDGELATTLTAPLPGLNSPLLVGGDSVPNSVGYVGEIDELELSKVARSLGFIKMEAFSQGADKATKMLNVGADEEPSNWLAFLNGGYFGVIIKSLTPDGWAVICILAFMSALSWFVMIRKNSALSAISKSNERFMKEWHHIAADLTVLDEGDDSTIKTMGGRMDKKGLRTMRHSPIYRIYHVGVQEIRGRLVGSSDRMKFLSALSMQAIRASMDGVMVREQQRINNLIVFLTLSISGGPFLGLLGTVVGVMITFAAVAAAGDVNVNAIAPGIAAALLATVAGLAVAIPALFGYNYLLARIKNANTDMHVFIDEFVTKAAEYYSKGEMTAASTMRLPRPAEIKPKSTPATDVPVASPRPSMSTLSSIPMKMEISRVEPPLEDAAPGA